ncbi:hypothetical protein D3C87_143130 [compost metagenome]
MTFTKKLQDAHSDHCLRSVFCRYDSCPRHPLGDILWRETLGTVKILEENHYYPFGLKHTNYNTDILAAQEKSNLITFKAMAAPVSPVPQIVYNYKYNGKEFQDERGLNWYDYGARNYDAALGRWMNMDMLAEKAPSWTPYRYAYDNPLTFVDPNGKYETDGHYWTVYLAGLITGHKNAAELAYYAGNS